MESIRINISKHLTNDGMVPVIAYPAEAAYDFRVHNFATDMSNLAALKAFEARVYPDGRNFQLSLIKDIQGGFIQFAILMDSQKVTLSPRQMLESLKRMASSFQSIAADDAKPASNPKFQKAISDIYKELRSEPQSGLPTALPVAKSSTGATDARLTYYMKYKTEGEVETLLSFPSQEFFNDTPSIYLIPSSVQPSNPRQCKQIHNIVLRTFKIVSVDGHEYDEVKEGETKRIRLQGKESMLPMTIDVRGDISAPSPYGYYDSTKNCIRIDERGIKFYYELKFLVKVNGRLLRSCTVRRNGEQVMPDANGCYVMKIYESDIENAGIIHFSGENFKDADIQITPGIVKQQEYIFTPEPQHDVSYVTLDFGDGRPIRASVDVGTNERLFQQLEDGRVKGYKVKKDGNEYKMFIPRKLTRTSNNILRLLKAAFMVALSLGLYAVFTYAMTRHWPWPIEQVTPVVKKTTTRTTFDKTGEIATQVEVDEDEEPSVISEMTDQVKLEAADANYLNTSETWRRDSIQSEKYSEIVNTIFNGSIDEIRLKNYDTRLISNQWWTLIWRQVMAPNAVHKDKVKMAFTKSLSTDRTTLNVRQLYEELSVYLHPTDGIKNKPLGY
jgi:hypothetical protein